MKPAPWPDFDGTQPCLGADDAWFFPAHSHTITKQAAALCSACPFARPCLAYALTHHVGGIWAGTNEYQRTLLRKEHGIEAEGLDSPVAAFSTSATAARTRNEYHDTRKRLQAAYEQRTQR